MTERIEVMISEEEVNAKIRELAEQISHDYAGKTVHLITILKGGVFFAAELAKRLTVPVTIDFMSVSSYGSGTISSGGVRMVKDLDEPIEDLDVLVVEDVIDSGRTLKYLLDNLGTRKPASLRRQWPGTVALLCPP